MCGFLQLFKKNMKDRDIDILRKGAATIVHRGPDDTKEVIYDNAAFIFNILSIIDIEGGAQPFVYKDRYTIVFNGEIYNYKELREELVCKNYNFKTNSECEIIAAAYDAYKDCCVNKFRGMFAVVIYDKVEEKIIAFRDNFGIKPLYYMEMNDGLYFSSELKGLREISSSLTYMSNLIGEYATF